MPRTPRVADGTVVLMHAAAEGEPREEAKVVGYDSDASRYIVRFTSSGDEHRVSRGQFDVPESETKFTTTVDADSDGNQVRVDTPAAATPHRGRQADPNSPGYQKDPEKFYYEQGYADGKRGHDFRPEMAEGHPRYTRGFAKHRPDDVPEAFRKDMEKAKKEAEAVPA